MFRIRTLLWVTWWALTGRLSGRGGHLYVSNFNYRGQKHSVHDFDMGKHWYEQYY